MNETETTALLNRLAGDVPVGPVPLVGLVRDGHRARRRRTSRAAIATAAVVAVIAATAALVATSVRDRSDTHSVADPDVHRALADYDAAGMPHLLLDRSRDAFKTGYPDLPEGVFAADDAMNDLLPPDLYDKASWVSVDYRATPVQALSVRVGHQTDPSGDSLTDQCTSQVSSGRYASCDVVPVRGQQAMNSVLLVTWAGGEPRPYENLSGRRGAPVEHLPAEVPTLDPDTIWYQHTVELTHPGGYVTLVTESVKATTLTAAQRLFRLHTSTMADLASDPDLVIPRPPTAGPGCASWTLRDYGQTCTTTDADTATAQRVLSEEVGRTGANLTSATFRVVAGTVPDPNTDATRCSSGRLLHLTLIGTFTKVVTSGAAPNLTNPTATTNTTVHGIAITADAASGQVCKVSVKRGQVAPEPHSTSLTTN